MCSRSVANNYDFQGEYADGIATEDENSGRPPPQQEIVTSPGRRGLRRLKVPSLSVITRSRLLRKIVPESPGACDASQVAHAV